MAHKYQLTDELEQILSDISTKLNIDRCDALGRAIVLLNHAVNAKEIRLVNQNDVDMKVVFEVKS
jgi:hypothetical protein